MGTYLLATSPLASERAGGVFGIHYLDEFHSQTEIKSLDECECEQKAREGLCQVKYVYGDHSVAGERGDKMSKA